MPAGRCKSSGAFLLLIAGFTLSANSGSINPTASNRWVASLRGDFTDSDGDGMTDVAERRFGYDPLDADSFPPLVQPLSVEPETLTISSSPPGLKALAPYLEVLEKVEASQLGNLRLRFTAPPTGSIALRMKYDGVPALFATVKDGYLIDLASLPLRGRERLSFVLHYYGEDGNWRSASKSFVINLAELEFPLRKLGGAGNRLGFIYDDDLSEESRSKYERYLRRLYPLLHANLGPPAEVFNVRFDLSERSGTFMSVDWGRRILTNGSFNPRLIAHELIHAWKGKYLISSDNHWRFSTDLLGFEEAIAEGGAFVLMQQYVRAYPDDPATIKLLKSKPYQYWSHKTFVYDSINHLPVTGAGDFFADSKSGVYYLRYTIAATTVQLLVEANSEFLLKFHRAYYDTIKGDPEWRPNRDDIVALWAGLVDELQGYPLKDFLGSIPVFNGTKLAQGFYFQNEIRPYGLSGDFQFAPIYIRENGKMLWWAYPRDLTGKAALPEWLPTLEVNTEKYGNLIYVDTQGLDAEVAVHNVYGDEVYREVHQTGDSGLNESGAPVGYGWFRPPHLQMQNFPFGLYTVTVTMEQFLPQDQKARESCSYAFEFPQNKR